MLMERLRRTVRLIFATNSWPYRFGVELLNAGTIIRVAGLDGYRQLRHLKKEGDGVRTIFFDNLAHPISGRHQFADYSALTNNIAREEYGAVAPREKPKVLVDGGAYIGDTAAWFLSKYPELVCYALEPQADNVEIARKNLAPYGSRAILMECALSGDEGYAEFGGEAMGGAIGKGMVRVRTTSVPALLKIVPGGRINILKMDIEGAERDVIQSGADEWLHSVDMIIVELHSAEIRDVFDNVMRAHDFIGQTVRSLTFYSRRET